MLVRVAVIVVRALVGIVAVVVVGAVHVLAALARRMRSSVVVSMHSVRLARIDVHVYLRDAGNRVQDLVVEMLGHVVRIGDGHVLVHSYRE